MINIRFEGDPADTDWKRGYHSNGSCKWPVGTMDVA